MRPCLSTQPKSETVAQEFVKQEPRDMVFQRKYLWIKVGTSRHSSDEESVRGNGRD